MARVTTREPYNVRCSYSGNSQSVKQEREKRCVQSMFLNVDNVGAERMSSGRLFQVTRPATQNARQPSCSIVFLLAIGDLQIFNDDDDDDDDDACAFSSVQRIESCRFPWVLRYLPLQQVCVCVSVENLFSTDAEHTARQHIDGSHVSGSRTFAGENHR